MSETPFYRTRLGEELSRRTQKNSRYSLRAFARAMDIDVGLLSKVMSSKRRLSLGTAYQLVDKINMEPGERRMFLQSVIAEQAHGKIGNALEAEQPHEIAQDQFRVIADLHHYAILELTYLKDFQSSVPWIAAQLGMTVFETRLAIERLTRLGLLKDVNGQLVKTTANLTTADKSITTPAHIKHQKQALEKAIESLESDPVEIRNMTSMTLSIDPRKLPVAKKMIAEFMEQLADQLEAGTKTKVYELTVNLYPLQKEK